MALQIMARRRNQRALVAYLIPYCSCTDAYTHHPSAGADAVTSSIAVDVDHAYLDYSEQPLVLVTACEISRSRSGAPESNPDGEWPRCRFEPALSALQSICCPSGWDAAAVEARTRIKIR